MIKLLTWNILDGGTGRENLILEVIERAQADIVLLEEVIETSVIGRLSRALDMKFFLANGNTKRNLAVLSRFRIVSNNSYHPFPLKCTLLEAAFEYSPGHCISLFGLHLAPYYHFLFELWRIWEVHLILERINQVKANEFLVAGDFNAVAPGDQVDVEKLPALPKFQVWLQGGWIPHGTIARFEAAGLVDCYRLLHPNADGFTLPASTPHVRLDYIFANRALQSTVQSCDVVTQPDLVRKASDHLPLILELRLG